MDSERGMKMLKGEKLKTLAKLIRYQEDNRIKSAPFKSEDERAHYLQDGEEARQLVVCLVDEAVDLPSQLHHSHNPVVAELAKQYLGFVECGVNAALRTMANLHFRLDYLKKFHDQAKAFVDEIKDIDANLPDELGVCLDDQAKDLIEKLSAYEEAYYQYLLNWKHPASKQFASYLKKKGIRFDKLVHKYQLKLVREKGAGFGGRFEDLSDSKKIMVYNEIVVSSGRDSLILPLLKYLLTDLESVVDKLGKVAMLVNVAWTVWDIYSSDPENRPKTAAKDVAKLIGSALGGWAARGVGAEIGAWLAGTEVGVAAAETIALAVGVEVAVVTGAFVILAAVAVALVFGYFVGKALSSIAGSYFHTGGKAPAKPKPTPPPPPPKQKPSDKDIIHVYVAPLPNGDLLARQLTYGDDDNDALTREPFSFEKALRAFPRSLVV